jgi:hypothetical protein
LFEQTGKIDKPLKILVMLKIEQLKHQTTIEFYQNFIYFATVLIASLTGSVIGGCRVWL